MFCYNNKMLSCINKTFRCCSRIFGCSDKKLFVVPHFAAVTKQFFPRKCHTQSKQEVLAQLKQLQNPDKCEFYGLSVRLKYHANTQVEKNGTKRYLMYS